MVCQILQLDVCFEGTTAPFFSATTCDAADPACLLRVHERAFRRFSQLQTLDGGLTGPRLIFVSAPKDHEFLQRKHARSAPQVRRDEMRRRRARMVRPVRVLIL